jgi:hypothetical protein
MIEQGRRGAHSFAWRCGRTRWLARAVDGSRLGRAAQARGARLGRELVHGDARPIVRGVRAHTVAWLGRTVPD